MPEPGRTSIEFVVGGQSQWLPASSVEAWALPHRFAVVQHTYRADLVDLFRDRALWLRLFEFAKNFSKGNAPTIVDEESREVSCDSHFARQQAVSDGDWDAPRHVIVRENGTPVLVIATEYWANIGGPKIYHDSMTYSLFSKERLEDRVMRPRGGAWRMS